jgi:hypothetical protein
MIMNNTQKMVAVLRNETKFYLCGSFCKNICAFPQHHNCSTPNDITFYHGTCRSCKTLSNVVKLGCYLLTISILEII